MAQEHALNPVAIEYFDADALLLAGDRIPDLPSSARAALFIEIEHDGEPPLDVWWEAIVASGALADDTIVADDEMGDGVPDKHADIVRNGKLRGRTGVGMPSTSEVLSVFDQDFGGNFIPLHRIARDVLSLDDRTIRQGNPTPLRAVRGIKGKQSFHAR